MPMCSIVCVPCAGSVLRRASPFSGWDGSPDHLATFTFEGRPEGRPGERPQAEYHAITADYFKTLEIPVRAGRDFESTDTPERPRVAIINETLARTAFPGESPIGQRIRTGTNSSAPWMEIVGIVGDTRWQDPSQPAQPVIYAASTQGAGNSPAILARTSLDDQSLARTLRTILHDADPTVPVKFETMDGLFDSTLAYPRFRTQVIGLFAAWRPFLPSSASSACSRTWWGNGHGSSPSAGPWAPGPLMSSAWSLVKGCGWSRSAWCWDLPVRSPWRGCSTGLLYEIGPWDVGTYLGTIVVLGSAALRRHSPSRDQSRHDHAARRAPARVAARLLAQGPFARGCVVKQATLGPCDGADVWAALADPAR